MDQETIDISIIIPIYNEEENIVLLYEKVHAVLRRLDERSEILFIDDGSTDGSFELLKQIADKESEVRVVQFKKNFGQTAAIQAGIDNSTGEIVIPLDADLQNDPEDIPRLLEKIDEGYDVVSGWRKDRKDKYFSRILPSKIANFIISLIGGVKLHDYGCTLKAYKREVLQDVRLYGEMHRFIPIYAHWQGASICEIAVGHHPRRAGKSKYGLSRVFKVLLDLILIKFFHSFASKPIYLFGGIGAVSFALSFLSGCWAIYLKWFRHPPVNFNRTPLPQLTVFLVMLGFMFVLMGIIAEIQMRTYFEAQGKKSYLIKNVIKKDDGK